MSVSLLTVVQRVSRNLGLDPTITSFSDNNDTNLLVQFINEAYEDIFDNLPEQTPFRNSSATISTVNGTRLYNLASNAMPFDLYEWSFENTTPPVNPIQVVTKDWVFALDQAYQSTTGTPKYFYPEGNQKIGFYPVPNAVFTITYEYGITTPARLSLVGDTFLIPDRWVKYIEKSAQEKYERQRGYGDPDRTYLDVQEQYAIIQVEAWQSNPTYFINEGLA